MFVYAYSVSLTLFNPLCQNKLLKQQSVLQQATYRRSYMSAHVLLNLLNKLRKSDKMRGLLRISSLFRNEFNKFNNSRAGMLDSIYHMTLRLLWNPISGVKMS